MREKIIPVLWLLTAAVIIGACLGVQARAEPCYLPQGVPARVAPDGMDDSIWPPCEPYPPPSATYTHECMYRYGNPDGSICTWTNPVNGMKYIRWGYHAESIDDPELNGTP